MKKYILLLAICLASFLGCLDLTIVNTALPAIQISTGASLYWLQWIVSGLLATLSATMVLAGRLADLFGRRWLLLIGLLLFGMASLLAGLASNISTLIIARILQGLGIAVLYTVPAAVINHTFEQNQLARAMGWYFSASSLGIASGPLLGGFIVAGLGWHWIFFLNVPIVIVSFIICYWLLPKDETMVKEKLDLLGVLLLILSLLLLLLGVSYIENHYMLISLILFLAAIGFILVFIWHESRFKYPLLELDLFRIPQFSLGGLANVGLACFYAVAFFLMPLYLHHVKNLDEFSIGLMLLPATMTLALISAGIGWIVKRVSIWVILATGFAWLTISAYLQMQFNQTTSLMTIMFAYICLGIGWALILSPSFTSALMAVPKARSGVVTGALGTLHNAGGSIGLAVGVLLFAQPTEMITPLKFIASQEIPFLFLVIEAGLITLILAGYAYTRRTS